jgi:hypothetical protein
LKRAAKSSSHLGERTKKEMKETADFDGGSHYIYNPLITLLSDFGYCKMIFFFWQNFVVAR